MRRLLRNGWSRLLMHRHRSLCRKLMPQPYPNTLVLKLQLSQVITPKKIDQFLEMFVGTDRERGFAKRWPRPFRQHNTTRLWL